MNDPDPISLHRDPLSEGTRKERRNLIISCVLGFLVSQAGLVPTRAELLGIEFSSVSPRAFLVIIGAIIGYFLVAFLIYGLSDFFAWRKRYYNYTAQVDAIDRNWTEEDQREYDDRHERIPRAAWIYAGSKPLSIARVIFEFFIPILTALASLICLGVS